MQGIKTHVVIPDTQTKPGVAVDHLGWIGSYIVDRFAGQDGVEVIHLGDHWDMPSLSSYDRAKPLKMEGRRYVDDIRAGNEALEVLDQPLNTYNEIRRDRKMRQWQPKKRLLRGNHEERILRATDADAQLKGLLGMEMLSSPGWEVYDFLEPVAVDGVVYSHYFYNPLTGRPYAGQAITRLKTVGHSFTMGHVQTLDYAVRFVGGRQQNALIAGACYLHDEEYLGPQGNAQWRGIVVCHQVEDGGYDPMFVSLDYLCRRYEGVRLDEYTPRRFLPCSYS